MRKIRTSTKHNIFTYYIFAINYFVNDPGIWEIYTTSDLREMAQRDNPANTRRDHGDKSPNKDKIRINPYVSPAMEPNFYIGNDKNKFI